MLEEFFILLRLGLGTESVTELDIDRFCRLTTSDWRYLCDLSFDQSVAPLTADGLQKMLEYYESSELAIDLPEMEDVKYEWLTSCMQVESENLQQRSVAIDLARKWAEGGCRIMMVKGQAMGLYYPVPEHRAVGDIDIYLFDDYERGNDIARYAGGHVDTSWYKHSQIYYREQVFENHLFFVTTREGKRSKQLNDTLCGLLEGQSFPCFRGSDILLPPVDFNALFLTYHSLSHFVSEGLRLKQVVDWAMFLKEEQTRIAWPMFSDLCDRFHFTRYVNVLNDIAVHCLGVSVTSENIVCESPYTGRVLSSIFNDNDYVFGSGESNWSNRLKLIRNLFKYRWKYKEIYQSSIIKQLFLYASGFIFHTEG